MDDLISRNKLLQNIEDWHDSLGGTMNPAVWGIQNVLQLVMDVIIQAPGVIDAVKVIRCDRCKHYETDCGYCDYWETGRNIDDFCSRGVRKEDDYAQTD